MLQAYCIAPPLGGPDPENQGALLVKLGAPLATAPPQPARPTRSAVQEAAQMFGLVSEVWECGGPGEGLCWQVHFADTQAAEVRDLRCCAQRAAYSAQPLQPGSGSDLALGQEPRPRRQALASTSCGWCGRPYDPETSNLNLILQRFRS